MDFSKQSAEVYIPDGASLETAFGRTESLCIAAHPDDIEIMAVPGILEAHRAGGWKFFGIIATDGVGTLRGAQYAALGTEEVCALRVREAKEAALLGRYSGLALLHHESAEIKDACASAPSEDLKALLRTLRPRAIHLHNPFDRHDVHVAVCLRSIAAIRAVAAETGWKPEAVYGGENRRGLGWLVHCDRLVLPVDDPDAFSDRLLHTFRSQNVGVRQFDQAVRGRRIGNATWEEGQEIHCEHELALAVDLLPLIEDPSIPVCEFVRHTIERFRADVMSRLERFSPHSPCRMKE